MFSRAIATTATVIVWVRLSIWMRAFCGGSLLGDAEAVVVEQAERFDHVGHRDAPVRP
jgi:hypothetical protein